FGVGRETETLPGQRADQERVNRRAGAIVRSGRWDPGLAKRLKRPKGAFLLGDAAVFAQFAGLRAGRLCAGNDPLPDQRHLFAGEFLVALRHFAAPDQFEQRALIGLAWDKDRAVVTSLKNQTTQTQVEAAFQLFAFAVALEAVRLENRTDIFFEDWGRGDGCRHESKEQPDAD